MPANAGQKMKSTVDLGFERTAVTDRRYRRPSRPDASPSRDESASIRVSIRNLSSMSFKPFQAVSSRFKRFQAASRPPEGYI